MVELKSCPFCGGAAHLIEGHREHWRAQCSKCGANIGEWFANGRPGEDKRLATEAWNTRAPASEPSEVVVDAGAKAMVAANLEDWDKLNTGDQGYWRSMARACLEGALKAAEQE